MFFSKTTVNPFTVYSFVGHAFFRALRNPVACPNNAICVFSVRFFFSKDLLSFFHRKKLFLFCFNYVFFLKEFTLFFPHKKSFFVFFLITFFFFPQRIYIFFHTKKVFSFSPLKPYGCHFILSTFGTISVFWHSKK